MFVLKSQSCAYLDVAAFSGSSAISACLCSASVFLRPVMSVKTTTAPTISSWSFRMGVVVYSTGKYVPSRRQNTSSSTRQL
jgi:hypothetical protein